jgi:hypothetical protein
MTTRIAETSPLIRARVAGLLYLLLVPLGIFAILYGPVALIVSGDAMTTANNIMASESLFRLSIVSALLSQIVGVGVTLALYQLLKPVDKNMALLMVIFSLLGMPITMLTELTHVAALQLLSGADYLTIFTTEQLQALALLFLDLHGYGLTIAGIFWGLWLFPLGYLVFKSGFLPRILGVLLILGCFGYLIDSFGLFLFPDYNLNIALYTGWSEVIFPLWLVIKGVNVEQQEQRALEAG